MDDPHHSIIGYKGEKFSAVIISVPSLVEALRKRLPSSLRVVPLDEWADLAARTFEPGSGVSAVDVAMADQEIIAAVVEEYGGSAALEQLRRLNPSIAVWSISEPDDADGIATVSKQIVDRLLQHVDEARKALAVSRRSLAILRRDYDRLQNNFSDVEQFLYSLGGPRASLCLEYPRTAVTVPLPVGDAASGARQVATRTRLPISAAGLAAVEVFVDQTIGNVHLRAEIRDLTGKSLAVTAVALRDGQGRGWHRLSFARAVSGEHRDCELALTVVGASEERASLRIALAAPHPIVDLCTVSESGETLGAPIALRVWRGLPGAQTRPREAGDHGSVSSFLRPGDLGAPRLLRCDDPGMGFEPVAHWDREDAFLVHPPARGLTLALVERVPVTALSRVTALVHNAHEEAPPIRFALAVVPGGYGRKVDPVPMLSSWVSLPPRCWGEVHAEPEQPLSGEADIVLASMVAGGDSNRMAWALFRGFSVWA